MLSSSTHSKFSFSTNNRCKEVIRWLIVWQVLPLLTRFPIHYVLYWLYYFPLECILKAIFFRMHVDLVFFHYICSWYLSLTVHNTSILIGTPLFSPFFRDITRLLNFHIFLLHTFVWRFHQPSPSKFVHALQDFRSTSPFLSTLLSRNVASFPVEYLLRSQ